jgi:hypothetical protein
VVRGDARWGADCVGICEFNT